MTKDVINTVQINGPVVDKLTPLRPKSRKEISKTEIYEFQSGQKRPIEQYIASFY